MYESNLDELSKDALIAMVKVYRQKEKMWKEKQLGLEPVTAQGSPIIIPTQAQLKAELQSSEIKKPSGRNLNRESSSAKDPAKKATNKSFRMPINLSALQTTGNVLHLTITTAHSTAMAKQLEKEAKAQAQEFLQSARLHKDIVPFGGVPLSTDKPQLSRQASEIGRKNRNISEVESFQHFNVPHDVLDQFKQHLLHPANPITVLSDNLFQAFDADDSAVKSSTLDDIGRRLSPEHNDALLHSHDIYAESINFIKKHNNAKESSMRYLEELQVFAETVEHACDMGLRYDSSLHHFSAALFRLKGHMSDYGSSLLPNSLSRFGEVISEMADLHQELISSMMTLLVVPIRLYVEEQQSNLHRVARTHKRHEELYDAALTKHMKKVSESTPEDEELTQLRDLGRYRNCACYLFSIQSKVIYVSMEYAERLNEIEILGKLNFVNSIAGFLSHCCEFSDAQHRLFQYAPPFLKSFGGYLTKGKSLIVTNLPKLTMKSPTIPRAAESRSKKRGYLHMAKAVQKGKTTGWKRTYFEIDGGYLIQFNVSEGELKKRLIPLLTSSVKPRKDLDRQLVFEINAMVSEEGNKSPHAMNATCLILQAETPQLYQEWLSAIQAGIMDSLAGQSEDNETNKKQAFRIKLSPEIRSKLSSANPTCADCSNPDPDWVSINTGVMMCIECSGVHRNLGVDYSKIRSVTLDKWDVMAYKLLLALGNQAVNELLESKLEGGGPTGDYYKITPDAARHERDRFISAKYRERLFVREVDSADKQKLFIQSIRKMDLLVTLQYILNGADVNAKDPKTGYTPLVLAIDLQNRKAAQLLLANGAEVDRMVSNHTEADGDTEFTALHLAAKMRDAESMALLVSYGAADTTIKDTQGRTPKDVLESTGEVNEALRRALEGYDPETSEIPISPREFTMSSDSSITEDESRRTFADPAKSTKRKSSKRPSSAVRTDEESARATRQSSKTHMKSQSDAGLARAALPNSNSSNPNKADKHQSRSTTNTPVKSTSKSRVSVSSAADKVAELKLGSHSRSGSDLKSPEFSEASEENDNSEESDSSSFEQRIPLPDVQVFSPRIAEVLRAGTSPTLVTAAGKPAVRRVIANVRVLKKPTATAGKTVRVQTSAVKDSEGNVLKGDLGSYETDIMGPEHVDGTVVEVSDDGAITLEFLPESSGEYFIQIYFNESPVLYDYYEVQVKPKK